MRQGSSGRKLTVCSFATWTQHGTLLKFPHDVECVPTSAHCVVTVFMQMAIGNYYFSIFYITILHLLLFYISIRGFECDRKIPLILKKKIPLIAPA